ncbi:hypothetical protein J2728_002799 [Caulobacter segnis]|nr:hypothetical protein [Caulobacter segnis]
MAIPGHAGPWVVSYKPAGAPEADMSLVGNGRLADPRELAQALLHLLDHASHMGVPP